MSARDIDALDEAVFEAVVEKEPARVLRAAVDIYWEAHNFERSPATDMTTDRLQILANRLEDEAAAEAGDPQ